jgi:hypothetical protein
MDMGPDVPEQEAHTARASVNLQRRLPYRTDGHSIRGGRDSPKAVTLNKVRDYRVLEREYVTSQMSLRELCRRHGTSAHSLVVVQAKQGKWADKREAYRARESDTFIKHHAGRMAAREAEVRIHAIEAINEAITKFRSDMQRTEKKLIGGEWVEVPVMLIGPKDVALLIDRFQVLFARPSVISQHQGINVTSEALPIDALQEFIERTRGLAEPAPQESPIPRSPRRLDG